MDGEKGVMMVSGNSVEREAELDSPCAVEELKLLTGTF